MRAAALAVLLAAAEALSAPKPRSRLFLDSASLADWQELLPTGLFYGVTTNPTILARDGVSCDVKSVSALARRAGTSAAAGRRRARAARPRRARARRAGPPPPRPPAGGRGGGPRGV